MKLFENYSLPKYSFIKKALFAILLTEFILFLGTYLHPKINFDSNIGLTAFTAIPLFVITILQLGRNIRLQRASFVKEYISQFYINPDLNKTFHELIYNYNDDIFEKIDSSIKVEDFEGKARPIFEPLEEFQNGREIGSRFYHPNLFQFSEEERKLDALLGYFDVIGYYHARGLLFIEDIAGSIGYYLAIMGQREVVDNYINLTHSSWVKLPYEKSMGATPPFSYLKRLLEDIKNYNDKFETEIKNLQRTYT